MNSLNSDDPARAIELRRSKIILFSFPEALSSVLEKEAIILKLIYFSEGKYAKIFKIKSCLAHGLLSDCFAA